MTTHEQPEAGDVVVAGSPKKRHKRPLLQKVLSSLSSSGSKKDGAGGSGRLKSAGSSGKVKVGGRGRLQRCGSPFTTAWRAHPPLHMHDTCMPNQPDAGARYALNN